jgi:hypothetical protein
MSDNKSPYWICDTTETESFSSSVCHRLLCCHNCWLVIHRSRHSYAVIFFGKTQFQVHFPFILHCIEDNRLSPHASFLRITRNWGAPGPDRTSLPSTQSKTPSAWMCVNWPTSDNNAYCGATRLSPSCQVQLLSAVCAECSMQQVSGKQSSCAHDYYITEIWLF